MTQKFEKIFQTGKWWELDYFQEEKLATLLPYLSKEETQKALQTLKEIFNEKWFLKQCNHEKPRHPLFSFFLIDAPYPLSFLINFGRDLSIIKEKVEGSKPLIKLLKSDKENFFNYLEEIKIGAWLVTHGFRIKKLKNNVDYEIQNEQKLYIEIKRFGERGILRFFENFNNLILFDLISEKGFGINIELNIKFAKALKFAFGLKNNTDEEKMEFLKNIIKASVEMMKKEIKKSKFNGITQYFTWEAKVLERTDSYTAGIRIPDSFWEILKLPSEALITQKIEEAVSKFKKVDKFRNSHLIIFIETSHIEISPEVFQNLRIYLETFHRKYFPFLAGVILYQTYFIENKFLCYKWIPLQKDDLNEFFNIVVNKF